jgi:hypothetical protein
MSELDSFALSRVYGLGWSAARGKLADGQTDLNEKHAASLNPYAADPEQARWSDGFKAGLRGWRGRSPSGARFRRT